MFRPFGRHRWWVPARLLELAWSSCQASTIATLVIHLHQVSGPAFFSMRFVERTSQKGWFGCGTKKMTICHNAAHLVYAVVKRRGSRTPQSECPNAKTDGATYGLKHTRNKQAPCQHDDHQYIITKIPSFFHEQTHKANM